MRDGAYRILEALGTGGMGALYLAADTGAFDRACVIKELLDYYDPSDPNEARKAQARFETEARLLAQLSHPGIPRIYTYFTEAGRHYIVMEYIEGETLQQAVTHVDSLGRAVPARPLPVEEVVRHAIRICKVLEYLAGQPRPVIHHDIKPANLIVDRTSGEVRLVDFGTAKTRTPWATQTRLGLARPTPAGPRAGEASSAYGTAGYAPPEQFQGNSEPRSDVFALAATVYHLLTDEDPGDDPFQFPRLATLQAPLGDALRRALRPEVRRRSTAIELRQALEAWLIPEGKSQPFVFGSGAVAHTTAELAGLCDQNWAEARKHLQNGDFDAWFRARNRHDLAAKAVSARLDADPDAALEAFLRRLNPRLQPPRLVVEPMTLRFGRLSRRTAATRRLVLRNEGRGYAQAAMSASVPWIGFDPPQTGCLAGDQAVVAVHLDSSALPLRRDHQAVIACTTARGSRLSIPVEAELDVLLETVLRAAGQLDTAFRRLGRGVRWGWSRWLRLFDSLLRSRVGLWILLVETLVLAVAMVALSFGLRERPLDPLQLGLGFVQALPLALLAVYLLPALACVGLGILREGAGMLFRGP